MKKAGKIVENKNSEADKTDCRTPARTYSAGLYARLSVDGDERKNESIETQLAIAEEFISRQSDITVYARYTDVGSSGTNFRREGFARMMRDVQRKRIDCIIVKDLSRFGRNHVETGNYLEKIFPFLDVRFIAVADGIDSRETPCGALDVGLKNLVNEMYARDIARRVRTGKQLRRAQGGYTGGVPPYGYRAQRVGGQRRLFVDEAAAAIVKKIYGLFVSGGSLGEIAAWLYGEGIVSPSEYHRSGRVSCQDVSTLRQWGRGTLRGLLTNPAYMGKNYEAIVSEAVFYQAAARLEKRRDGGALGQPAQAEAPDLFAEVLCCGGCGAGMKRTARITRAKGVRTFCYRCPNSERIDKYKCVTKSISQQALSRLVRRALQQAFALTHGCAEELEEKADRVAARMEKQYAVRLAALARRAGNIAELMSGEYASYRMGEIDARTFQEKKQAGEKKMAMLEAQREELQKKLEQTDAQLARGKRFFAGLAAGDAQAELTAEAVRALIEKIEVCPDRRVRITFRFRAHELLRGGEKR